MKKGKVSVKAKQEKETIKKQVSKLIKSAKTGDSRAKRLLLAIIRFKTQEEIDKKNHGLREGMVIDGNKIIDSNVPLKDGDVIDWNQYEYD